MTQVPLILPQSITAIGSFTAFDNAYLNAGLEDYLAIDPNRCSGFGDAALRSTIFDAPGEDGELIFPSFDGQLAMTLYADIVVTSTGSSNDDGYMAAVASLYAEFKAAIDALKSAPDDLVHSAGSMKVWKNGPVDPSFPNSYWQMGVTFSLIQDVFAS